jgi:hypothetical protein
MLCQRTISLVIIERWTFIVIDKEYAGNKKTYSMVDLDLILTIGMLLKGKKDRTYQVDKDR